MGIISAGYLSPFKNKLGNAVGRRWRNLNVIAAYNNDVSNPRTSAQQMQRGKLALLSGVGRSFRQVTKMGLDGFCKGSKVFPRAMFVKLNMDAVTMSAPDSGEVSYGELILSRGPVTKLTSVQPSFDTPAKIVISWDSSVLESQYSASVISNMKMVVVAYNPDDKSIVYQDTAVVDTDTTDLTYPDLWTGMRVHVYAFIRYDGENVAEYGLSKGDVSDSAYCGSGSLG